MNPMLINPVHNLGSVVETRRGLGQVLYAWPPGSWRAYGAPPAPVDTWTLGVQLFAGGITIVDEYECVEVRGPLIVETWTVGEKSSSVVLR